MSKYPPDIALSELYCCVMECVIKAETANADDDLVARARAATSRAAKDHPWLREVQTETGNYYPQDTEDE